MSLHKSWRGRHLAWIVPALLGLAMGASSSAQTAPQSTQQPGSPATTPATTPAAAGKFPAAIPSAPPAPTLTILSEPTGAVVSLRGPYEWVGQTPWQLYRDVSGLYRVEARMPGYETWKGDAVLGQGGVQQLTIYLSRKTRFKAAVRSLIIPGWGQSYQDRKGTGTLLLGAGVAAGVALVWTHEIYRDRVDSFNTAKSAYENATRQSDLPGLWSQVQAASNSADHAWDHQTLSRNILAGVYALSFLDALFFGPGGHAEVTRYPAKAENGAADGKPGTSFAVLASPAASGWRTGLTYRW